MYTKNLFNVKKDPNTIQYCPCKYKILKIGKHTVGKKKIIPVLSIESVQHTEVFGSVLR